MAGMTYAAFTGQRAGITYAAAYTGQPPTYQLTLMIRSLELNVSMQGATYHEQHQQI